MECGSSAFFNGVFQATCGVPAAPRHEHAAHHSSNPVQLAAANQAPGLPGTEEHCLDGPSGTTSLVAGAAAFRRRSCSRCKPPSGQLGGQSPGICGRQLHATRAAVSHWIGLPLPCAGGGGGSDEHACCFDSGDLHYQRPAAPARGDAGCAAQPASAGIRPDWCVRWSC